jgi:hypothetical protein
VGPWPEVCGLTYYHVMARGNRREDIFLDDNDRAGIEGGGAGSAGFQGLAWERREEGGVGEVPQGIDHGLLRVGGTGAVHGRGGERGALRANAAVEKCEEENPEGNVAVHRAES